MGIMCRRMGRNVGWAPYLILVSLSGRETFVLMSLWSRMHDFAVIASEPHELTSYST